MNRYTPFFNDDEMTVGMSVDKDGSWVHIATAERLRRELAEARAIIDKVEEIAVNNRTGCGTCTTVVNLVVSYAADQPDAARSK